MSQTQVSNQNLNKFEDDLKEIEDALQEYESQVAGLPMLSKMEAPSYMSMNMETLKRKTPEDLAEAVIALNQYALFLQRTINKEKAWKSWGESKLDDLSAAQIPEIGNGYGWNERMLMARTKGPMCQKLNKFLREVNMKLDRISYLPTEIHRLADAINNLRFAAMKKQSQENYQ